MPDEKFQKMFDVKKLKAKRDEKRKLSPRQPQKRQPGRVGLKEFLKRAPPPIDVLSDEEFIEHVIEKVRIISDVKLQDPKYSGSDWPLA